MRWRILSIGLLAFLFTAMLVVCRAKKDEGCYSSCGNISNISFPFGLKGDPCNCGYPEFQLSCESNRTVLHLHSNKKLWVEAIDYKNKTIRVIDSSLQSNDCSSLPHNSMTSEDLIGGDPYILPSYPTNTIFVNCSVQMDKDPASYIATTGCSNSTCGAYIYVLGRSMMLPKLHPSCKVVAKAPTMLEMESAGKSNYREIHDRLMKGFELFWYIPLLCRNCWATGTRCTIYMQGRVEVFEEVLGDPCYNPCRTIFQSKHCLFWILRRNYATYHGEIYRRIFFYMLVLVTGRTFIGIVCLIALLVYKLQRRHIWMDTTVEEFLSKYRCQTPARYSYWDIRRMTMHFKEKLGQGGFGSVYKGKLRNGPPVAIKMLSSKSKGNGQEFINEVATIGRIHHVNVVRLIGFCAEGSKRALIYEFMPNGSLEKYIYSHEGKSSPLSWEKMYQIALGIACGIEYLHQGCDMKILHFDIKPHNILLDDNFNPKVADFGLAKFYATDESHLSVTAVGGTLGYMAPELFYKNTRQVSYKSDVYSFGMLLMEMAGRRKNVNPSANLSQIYFPLWIYDKLDQDGEMGMEDAAEDEKEIAKKMVIVALWCIQMKPANRPSMSKVIEMLEGSVELLQMPAKPFHSSPQRVPDEDHATDTNPTESSSIEELGLLSENYEVSNNLDVIID
ncbi:rust resistance kinase Lr10-like isoform X1 [Magnolia sinica]|uniref:rust resistance kinase Lr10-like isoform X1 n=1 Tax=Magnolia sinica TaxID=86752 RepID=UPI0026598D79|nr:rust resistance kinase Lr10-like isoform X1 [Magnolia sinica]